MFRILKSDFQGQAHGELKFHLIRYFSTTSLIAFVIVTGLLGFFYRLSAMSDLIEVGESKNVALTKAFSNSLWPQFAPFLTSSAGLSGDELRAHPEIARLRQAVLEQMDGLSVVKVKIYNLEGLTVFSTEEGQIGEDKSSNAGFQAALSGRVASELTHRDTFSAFEGLIEDRDVFSSYVPIQQGPLAGQVEGVFEVYDDVTPLLQRIERTQRNVVIGVTLILTSLYVVLFFIVRHADKIIQRHQLGRRKAEQALKTARDELELKVVERTAELKNTAEQLQLELAERKRAEEQLLHNAFHDTLTGLPNRALFMDRLARTVEHARRRKGYLFAVLFLDLDHFKVVNDSLGHPVGDQLLVAVARRLESRLRSADTLARLGGDEFAILLDDIDDVNDAIRIVQRVQQELTNPFSFDSREVFVTASTGITLNTSGYEKAEDFLRDADIAMYRAKSLGRSRYQIFDKTMHMNAVARMRLEMDLRKALDREEFRVFYQPIYSLADRSISGFETLVRWQHPTRGLLLPGEFIPLAEETGLVTAIDLFVLRQACLQLRLWQEHFPTQPPLTVSVNLSGLHFAEPGLVEQINQILAETEIEPDSLQIEVTENALIENSETANDILLQLKSRGVRLHMDDFGTGYSSLSYLHRYPFHSIKIDRAFIDRIGNSAESWKIVQAVVNLAKNLGMGVIAEGVEREEQLEQLRKLECEYGQGFYFSRPVDSKGAEGILVSMRAGIELGS